jgi:hypothetical protein
MTTTKTIPATYRKTAQGDWVVLACADVLKAGRQISVWKKDGTRKTETIERVGKTFQIDGIDVAYGYIARPARVQNHSRGFCNECGEKATNGTRCWETGATH